MPGVFKTDILLFSANPDLGLICISKFSGIATDRPVGINFVSFGFIMMFLSIKAWRSSPDEPDVL